MLFHLLIAAKNPRSNWRNGTTASSGFTEEPNRFRQQRAKTMWFSRLNRTMSTSVGRKLAADVFGAFNSAKASAND